MAATASATAAAVPRDWLTVDKAAQIGPADYGDPQASPAPPVVPTAPSPFGLPVPVTAPDGGGALYDGGGAGAWPALPGSGDGRTWQDRGDGYPQGVYETTIPQTRGSGFWNVAQPLQTYDHLSQVTDTAGWFLNPPNDRVSDRNTFGQANPDNNPTWYPYSENAVTAHLAIRAAPYTADAPAAGSPGFGNGALPDWIMSGGQGNTAYETPAPPPSAAAAAVAVADPAAGWA
jgi:hypothetical protein